MGRKGHPLAARIKKMMQTDEDVGKIAQATPVMIARAMELFLQRLCKNAGAVAASRKAKTLTCSHLKAYVSSDELMDFLSEVVDKAPDLPPEGEAEAPKPKRQRVAEPKPKAPKGEVGKGRAKRESADGGAAAAAEAAEAAEEEEEPAGGAAAASPNGAAAASAAAVAVAAAAAAAAAAEQQQLRSVMLAPATAAVKQEGGGSSSPTAAAQAGRPGGALAGLSLGAHPFLAARTFGRPAPKQEAAQQQQQPPAAVGAGQLQQEPGAQQPPQQQCQASGVAPSVVPGLPSALLAAYPSIPAAEEDDYDD